MYHITCLVSTIILHSYPIRDGNGPRMHETVFIFDCRWLQACSNECSKIIQNVNKRWKGMGGCISSFSLVSRFFKYRVIVIKYDRNTRQSKCQFHQTFTALTHGCFLHLETNKGHGPNAHLCNAKDCLVSHLYTVWVLNMKQEANGLMRTCVEFNQASMTLNSHFEVFLPEKNIRLGKILTQF